MQKENENQLRLNLLLLLRNSSLVDSILKDKELFGKLTAPLLQRRYKMRGYIAQDVVDAIKATS